MLACLEAYDLIQSENMKHVQIKKSINQSIHRVLLF